MESTYDKQATDFLTKYGISFEAKFVGFKKHFVDDKEQRDCYNCTFSKGRKTFSVDFGQSIVKSGEWMTKDVNPKFCKTFATKNDAYSYRIATTGGIMKNPKREQPSAYDVLTCITKYNPGSFDNFCDEYGYNNDSIKAKEVWENVRNEWIDVRDFFTDQELDELQEIQ